VGNGLPVGGSARWACPARATPRGAGFPAVGGTNPAGSGANPRPLVPETKQDDHNLLIINMFIF